MDDVRQARIEVALREWVLVREMQASASALTGRAQQGNRAAVTGGAHLRGVDALVVEEIEAVYGHAKFNLLRNRAATVAGYYRATKSWDLLVVTNGKPILLVEYKSMSGSEGKNLNNRADEMFGIAQDARAAEEHGLLPPNLLRAFIFIMGANSDSMRPIGVGAITGTADPAFNGASYMDRMAIMLERMRDDGLYHLAWAVGVHEDPFSWFEPSANVNWDRFAADLRRLIRI
jgi:hypothetical protein